MPKGLVRGVGLVAAAGGLAAWLMSGDGLNKADTVYDLGPDNGMRVVLALKGSEAKVLSVDPNRLIDMPVKPKASIALDYSRESEALKGAYNVTRTALGPDAVAVRLHDKALSAKDITSLKQAFSDGCGRLSSASSSYKICTDAYMNTDKVRTLEGLVHGGLVKMVSDSDDVSDLFKAGFVNTQTAPAAKVTFSGPSQPS